MTADEMKDKLAVFDPYVDAKLRHLKTGNYYHVQEFAFLEADMSVAVVYETAHRPPIRFVRPVHELFDGRFEIQRVNS